MQLVLGIFKKLTLTEKVQACVIFALRVLLVAFDLLGILLIGAVVSLVSGTVISSNSRLGSVLTFLDEIGQERGYVSIAVVAVAFFTAKSLISIWLTHGSSKFISKIELNQSRELYAIIQNTKLEKLENFSKPQIVNSIGQGINSAFSQTIHSLSIVIGEAALLFAVCVLLFSTNALVFIVIAVFFAVVGVVMNRGISATAARSSESFHLSDISGQTLISEFLDNFRQFATSKRREILEEKFMRHRQVYASEKAKYAILTTLPRYVTEISVMFGVGILVLQRGSDSPIGIDSPTIAVFVAGIFRIVASMLPLQAALSNMKAYAPEAQLVLKVMNSLATVNSETKPEARQRGTATSVESPRRMVEIRGLSYSHGQGMGQILSNVNLDIKRGEYVAITGPSGAGKSTLADLILGLRTPIQGTVIINGVIANAANEEFRKLVSYVPQRTSLISGTLLENITFEHNIKFVNRGLLNKAIEICNLGTVIQKLPHGLETKFGAAGITLSGGELQRVGLARALYTAPKVLIIDEVTSALDPVSELNVADALTKLKGDVTIIAITHKRITSRGADRELRLVNGKLKTVSQSRNALR